MPLRSNSATVSRGAGGSLGAAADCGTRSIEGDAPRRDEFDLHVRGIYASLLESLPQQVCPGQRRRTLHVNDDHAAAGGDVARGPADLITERTRCRQRLGFACGVAADGDGCRSQGDTNGNYQCSDGKYRGAAVEGPPLGSSCGGHQAVETVERHHYRTAPEDRGDVRQEEEGSSQ